MLDHYATNTRATAAVAATLTLAAACWAVSAQQMQGMDMGPDTELGSFGFFMTVWIAMMAAMMLPGAVPALVRRAETGAGSSAVALFVASYLSVWTLVGAATYPLYRPHGTAAAGIVVLGAGVYELTPLKRLFRERCQGELRSGVEFGLCCVGSSLGLMLMLLALGVMNVVWMAIIATLVLAQKLIPPRRAVDVPLALVIVGLGVLILAAPSSVPGLTHLTSSM